jgi:hypothetical protein
MQHLQGQGMPLNVEGGGSSSTNAAAITSSLIAQLGPNAMHFIQLLQSPQNQFVNYMCQLIPNFMQLPVQQQVYKMQQVQVSLIPPLFRVLGRS